MINRSEDKTTELLYTIANLEGLVQELTREISDLKQNIEVLTASQGQPLFITSYLTPTPDYMGGISWD